MSTCTSELNGNLRELEKGRTSLSEVPLRPAMKRALLSLTVTCAAATPMVDINARQMPRYCGSFPAKLAIIPHELCATHRTSNQERATHVFLQPYFFFSVGSVANEMPRRRPRRWFASCRFCAGCGSKVEHSSADSLPATRCRAHTDRGAR